MLNTVHHDQLATSHSLSTMRDNFFWSVLYNLQPETIHSWPFNTRARNLPSLGLYFCVCQAGRIGVAFHTSSVCSCQSLPHASLPHKTPCGLGQSHRRHASISKHRLESVSSLNSGLQPPHTILHRSQPPQQRFPRNYRQVGLLQCSCVE